MIDFLSKPVKNFSLSWRNLDAFHDNAPKKTKKIRE
jgi:hypothetical protein